LARWARIVFRKAERGGPPQFHGGYVRPRSTVPIIGGNNNQRQLSAAIQDPRVGFFWIIKELLMRGDIESGPHCQDHFSAAISYGAAGLI
jgi:hypothetical protein